MSCYYFTDWTMSFERIVCVYLIAILKNPVNNHQQ